MKKNLTKLLALMMALALVFSLAACGDKTGDESSTDPSNNPAVANSDNEARWMQPTRAQKVRARMSATMRPPMKAARPRMRK